MPEMTGFEVLEHLRADDSLRDLPVLVTSSLEGDAHVVRCLELGADDFLHKPVNPVLLKARVNSSLEKKRLRDQQKALISRFATAEVAQDLQRSGFAIGGRRLEATVLCTDIRDFTTLAESQPPEETIDLLNSWYALMFDAISGHGGVVNQIVGDGLLALFGAPAALPGRELAAVRAALEMAELVQMLNAERESMGKRAIQIGIGIATGPMIAGYTGTQQRAVYTCIGDTVNVASRMESHTKEAGRAILIDAATAAALDGKLSVEPLGSVQFRGKVNDVEVFAVGGTVR
jgi:class 3 adenylate cyclase